MNTGMPRQIDELHCHCHALKRTFDYRSRWSRKCYYGPVMVGVHFMAQHDNAPDGCYCADDRFDLPPIPALGKIGDAFD